MYGKDVDPEPDDVSEQIERDRLADEQQAQREWDSKFEGATGQPVDRGPIDDDEADIATYLSQRGRK